VVVPGNPVHGGGERVDVQPALVETIGKIPCFSHETRILTGETAAPETRVKANAATDGRVQRQPAPDLPIASAVHYVRHIEPGHGLLCQCGTIGAGERCRALNHFLLL
jgi:hypothetical protein